MEVIKRDGSIVPYDIDKIYYAIKGAFDELGTKFENSEAILADVDQTIRYVSDPIDIEDIQDVVENTLLDWGYREEAKAYVKYRYIHEIARKKNIDNEILSMINATNSYWMKENSNKNPESVTVQRDYLAGIISTDIAKNYIFPKHVIKAHDEGICHQHDMDYMAQSTLHNCELINLEDMLQNGTVVNNVRINKPHRLITAMTITTQIMAAVASSSYGGQSITLTHLAPFVRDSWNRHYEEAWKECYNIHMSDELIEQLSEKIANSRTQKEIRDAVQTFNYQASTLFTLNGQSPFCSLFIYLNETEEYKNELIMLAEEFLRQRLEGMPNRQGVNITQAFPKILYVLEEDNYKPGTKYWELTKLAAECSSKRLTPDYISEKVMKEIKINGDGSASCFPCMGCRSFLSPDASGNGFNNLARAKNYDGKPKYYGRFNCGVSSLNLPDIAFTALESFQKGEYSDLTKEEIFWKLLDERAEICHDGLKIRCERLSNTKARVAPILWMDGALARLDEDDTLYDLVHNGYSTVSLGYVGVYECVKIMTNESHTSPIGEKFAIAILEFLANKCEEWKAKENIGYSLYSTPAESLAYKFASKTKERYPKQFHELFGDKKYFENSYHVASFEAINAFDKILFESQFQKIATGGSISYIESSDLSNNQPILWTVLEYIYNHIMYCEINIITSYCVTCGMSQTIESIELDDGSVIWECKNCGERDTHKLNVAARTCGYIGTNFWNDGKTQEIHRRYCHLDDMEM